VRGEEKKVRPGKEKWTANSVGEIIKKPINEAAIKGGWGETHVAKKRGRV